MINREIRKLLLDKSNLSKRRIYQLIEKKRKEYGYTISRETAAYILAADHYDIDISKHLSDEELDKVREARRITIEKRELVPTKETPQRKIPKVRKKLVSTDRYLPMSVKRDAEKMSEVYKILYLFENSVRHVILSVMGLKYGLNWWEIKVSKEIKNKVEKRMAAEKKNRWHSRRGAHRIFYTDIEDLCAIVTTNWQDFENMFPDLTWVKSRIDSIGLSRNIVAHNNSPTKQRNTAFKNIL
jgi:hypothetical protein